FIEHVKQLESTLGNPRRTVLSPITLENDFRRANRVFKILRKDQALTIMNKNILVVNYNMLNPLYKYIASFKGTYFRWYNNQQTFINNVNQLIDRFPTWNHYLELEVPPTIPMLSKWTAFTNGITQENLGLFSTSAHLTAVDL